MMYQVAYKIEGHDFATQLISEKHKTMFIETLKNSGIEYTVVERKDKKWQIAICVFDLQLIDYAKQQLAAGVPQNRIPGVYTFGDEHELAQENLAVKVQCTDGREKNAITVKTYKWTADQINTFKSKIGYKHLGLVVGKP